MANKMVERVAMALSRDRVEFNASIERRALTPEFIDKAVEAGYPNFMREAKAAIQAMRKPTKEMINAGWWIEDINKCYQAMIDAALKE